MSKDYNQTVNLPKTDFPMRAGLPKREPDMLKAMEEKKIYARLMEKNAGKPTFLLHDGPPFSNNNIHCGTALNKILKDFIVRYKNMAGFHAPYVPGWDNHGMPIESAIIQKHKLNREALSIPEFRRQCEEFAMHYVDVQKESFIRLGCMGEWDNPYLTLDPKFEAREVEVFGAMAEKGYITRGLKPVYWCPHDETALAEAEIEYMDEPCTSVYVKFPVLDDGGKLGGDLKKTYFVIWTTTIWTLPGNLAISVNAAFDYAVVAAAGERYVMAKELVERTMKFAGIADYTIEKTLSGAELERMTARHPFLDRESLVITGDHVTLEAGTGCVHTAPGHGTEDYFACKAYDLPIVVPVDAKGHMTEEAGAEFAGMYYAKANKAIHAHLEATGHLFATEEITHSYPHCWRCKQPVIYRATEQFFASVEAFKDEAIAACESVVWMPGWGKERMAGMIRDRAEWCISRQRHWGLPIPVFYCDDCGELIVDKKTTAAVAALFEKEGSNAWYSREAADILPEGYTCPACGGAHFTKETDTLDGWFDSGSSHAAVLAERDGLHRPADLYLEGADQYRGWFQSSLLTAVATTGKSPYKAVLTHGWIVDGEGKKMSKSLGNFITPEQLIPKYGADVMRLWVSSVDYTADVRISDDIFKQLSDIYLKIRNTCRYMLGNLAGFNPDAPVAYGDMLEIDRFALHRLNDLAGRVRKYYDSYEFHMIYHAVHNFCVTDMSNFYLDIIKDRLYCEARDGLKRRSAQTAMHSILDGIVRMLAPILPFTMDEIWGYMTHGSAADSVSVALNDMPEAREDLTMDDSHVAKWERIIALRAEVNKALEAARAEKRIGKPLEAKILLKADPENSAFIEPLLAELPAFFIVSQVALEAGGEGVAVEVLPAEGGKCVRCWNFSETVGADSAHPELCHRCASVVSK
ncbi:isoleucine--tRNA ligase [Oscillospiraceae bacterium OttesenSCG-928-F05]|nr:isoleucine--tRNA ligase [Oscillospiraceae bacterium OttesenSCG-928-F05]